MEFSRVAARASWPDDDQQFHTYNDNSLCDTEEARAFDFLAGTRQGEFVSGNGGEQSTAPAVLKAWKVLNGCGILQILTTKLNGKDYQELRLRSYIPSKKVWLVLRLDSLPETGFQQQVGAFADGKIELTSIEQDMGSATTQTKWDKLDQDEILYEMSQSQDQGWQVFGEVRLKRSN